MLFHLFDRYPDKKFIIIGDYKYDVLEKYLDVFAEVDYQLVNAAGHKGTCGGIAEAVQLVTDGSAFMLIWSDLVLAEDYIFPEKEGNYLGLSGILHAYGNMKMAYLKKRPQRNMVWQGIFCLWTKVSLWMCQKKGSL